MRTVTLEDQKEIDEIIKSCKTCFVATCNDNVPYVLPMNFGYDGKHVILHSAPSGKMWETLQNNPKVCINWTLGNELVYQNEQVACSYRMKSKTVIAEGIVRFIDDYDQKVECLNILMKQYSDRTFEYSTPAIVNVGIMRVEINKITAKAFGEKPPRAW